MSAVARNGTTAYIGLPEREAVKLQDLWHRDEVGVELSVEVRAPVIVGVYPMRIARFVIDHSANGSGPGTVSGNGARIGHAQGNGSGGGLSPAHETSEPREPRA